MLRKITGYNVCSLAIFNIYYLSGPDALLHVVPIKMIMWAGPQFIVYPYQLFLNFFKQSCKRK